MSPDVLRAALKKIDAMRDRYGYLPTNRQHRQAARIKRRLRRMGERLYDLEPDEQLEMFT